MQVEATGQTQPLLQILERRIAGYTCYLNTGHFRRYPLGAVNHAGLLANRVAKGNQVCVFANGKAITYMLGILSFAGFSVYHQIGPDLGYVANAGKAQAKKHGLYLRVHITYQAYRGYLKVLFQPGHN